MQRGGSAAFPRKGAGAGPWKMRGVSERIPGVKKSAWSHRGKSFGLDGVDLIGEWWTLRQAAPAVRYANQLGLDLPDNGKLLPETLRGTSSCPSSKSI